MALKAGIVGLPNVGKSTLFNAVTKASVEAANYPFATIDPNVGVVEVKDERMEEIAKRIVPKNLIYTTFEFIDIAGLVKGASSGEGLGNRFLSHIREVDAICHVVRCFVDENITHVEDKVDPIADIEIINLELIMADLQSVDNRISRIAGKVKGNDKDSIMENKVLEKVKAHLEENKLVKNLELSSDEKAVLAHFNLLTAKPMLYVLNMNENDVANPNNNPFYKDIVEYAKAENSETVLISAKIEEDLSQLDEEEAQFFLEELNLESGALDQLIRKTYNLLDLETYFTAGEQEVRAWTYKKGTNAKDAAGIIHSDFARGFIFASVYSYADLMEYNSEANLKAAGKIRLEGKDYIVQDGDIIFFRFNV